MPCSCNCSAAPTAVWPFDEHSRCCSIMWFPCDRPDTGMATEWHHMVCPSSLHRLDRGWWVLYRTDGAEFWSLPSKDRQHNISFWQVPSNDIFPILVTIFMFVIFQRKNNDLSVPRKPGSHQRLGYTDILCCSGVSYVYSIYLFIPIDITAESKIDSPSNNSINT
jgi:hypothetical protein